MGVLTKIAFSRFKKWISGEPLAAEDYCEVWANAPMKTGLSSPEISLGKIFKAVQCKSGTWDVEVRSCEYREEDGTSWRWDGGVKDGSGLTTEAMIAFLRERDPEEFSTSPTHVSQIAKLAIR